ncbi:MAG: serine/threonine protein kinase, partial [Victivallales bacterium]|nr:serine/threonine protein kinase [Victivallales bacterium]
MIDFNKYNHQTEANGDDGDDAPAHDPYNKLTIDSGTNNNVSGGKGDDAKVNTAPVNDPYNKLTLDNGTNNNVSGGKATDDDNAAQKKGPWDITTINDETINDGGGENDGKKDSGHKKEEVANQSHVPQAGGYLVDGRYKILEVLGRGAMGVVYLCFDNVNKENNIVLKALPPEFSKDKARDKEIIRNFNNVNVRRGFGHQNIAAITNLETDSKGDRFLVMEYVNGMELGEWRTKKRDRASKRVSLGKALPILKEIADALDYAHSRNIMHRDLKPSNVMVTNGDGKDKVKVIDFGIAEKIYDSTRSLREYYGRSGTPAYMSPEQLRGEAQGAETDQYSLAVIAYEMLSGHLPFNPADYHFDNESDKTFKETVKTFADTVLDENNPPKPIDGLPSSVNDALLRALSKKPSDRFASCTEFVNALAPHEDSEGDHVSVGD